MVKLSDMKKGAKQPSEKKKTHVKEECPYCGKMYVNVKKHLDTCPEYDKKPIDYYIEPNTYVVEAIRGIKYYIGAWNSRYDDWIKAEKKKKVKSKIELDWVTRFNEMLNALKYFQNLKAAK